MAAIFGCLCLILTLWTTGSRLAAGAPPRSPDSSLLWDQDPLHLRTDAANDRKRGDFASAESLYRRGYLDALQHGDTVAAAKYLISAGGCQLAQFQYASALTTFVEARELALANSAAEDLGAIAVNLSSVYLQVWDVWSALRAVEDGLAQTAHRGGYSRPFLLVQAGRIHALLADGQAGALFAEGIEAARLSGRKTLEAQGWDLLGDEALREGRLTRAERSFGEAYRLRRLGNPGELGLSYFRLAALRLANNDLKGAALLNALATAAARGIPVHVLKHQRGEILLAQGNTAGALKHFSSASDAAARAGSQTLPTRAALVASNVALDERIFRSYIQLAAQQAAATGDARLAEQAFQAVEMSRAASLRGSLALADAWRTRLPPRYWQALEEFGRLEARRMQSEQRSAAVDRLVLKLSEMEAQAGGGISHKKIENFRGRSSLIHFQTGLGKSELLLSFWLGKTESYLWAVSRETLRMYRLPPEGRIVADVHAFRAAVRAGGAEAQRLGESLNQTLFGQLAARDIAKRAWLLSLEGALFDAPFAALVTGRLDGNTVYLVENHSLQTVPGALLLRAANGPEVSGRETRFTESGAPEKDRRGAGVLLAVGDPVYNTADPRWTGSLPGSPWRGPPQPATSWQLNRLVASEAEVSVSAAQWRASGGTATLLTGAHASRAAFLEAVEGLAGESNPSIVHLATHVLTSPVRAEQGFIAFGLSADQPGETPQPEFLETSQVAALHVPGALVVMTGCATGTGDARAGAGLLGLTHAWLMAGASGVVSTAWPVEDSPGEIFAPFYRHLRASSAAEALRLSQIGMIHSGTWRRAPAYWAAYQFTGGTR